MHDMAGLAGVLGYPLLGKIARGLIETPAQGRKCRWTSAC